VVYDIRFIYVVDGKEYRNNVVAYEKKNCSVEQRLETYPVGEKVTVYFDPSSPQWSVLERGDLSVYIYVQLAVNLILAPWGTYLIARYVYDL